MQNKSGNSSFIVRWPQHQIVLLGVVCVVVSLLSVIFVDQKLTRWANEVMSHQLTGIAEFVTWFGLGDTYFMIAVIGYLLARLSQRKWSHLSWARRLAEVRGHFGFMFCSFLASGILVLVLKMLFGRARPYHSVNYEPLNFQPFTLDWHYQSYPSGHTQVGFTLAAFLAILYPKGARIFFTLAALIGFSRVLLEKHYLGDVIAGAYVGILGTYLAWHWKGKQLLGPR